MSIYTKLQEVRAEFASSEMRKSGHNDFSNYDYFELSDFVPEAQRKFKEHGLCPVTTFPDRENACLTIYDSEDPSQYIEFHSPMGIVTLKGANDAQNVGSAETYARRYLYMAALELSEHDSSEDNTETPEITLHISRISTLANELIAADKSNRAKIAGVIRDVLGHTKYTEMKAGQEEQAKDIVSKLENMKGGN